MRSEIKDFHRLIQNESSCEQEVEKYLARAEGDEHNSTNLLLKETAIAQAKRVDEKLRKGEKIGVLDGVPFGVKDVFLLQGYPATASSGFLKSYVAPYTATAIQKLIDAGAIPIVKENCDAFGHGSTNENSVFGPVKNSSDEELVSGGSSGGSAVNVALKNTVFSIGGDTGGSIRQPAGYNGVWGMKPTYGRISRYGLMAYASSTDCVGLIARTVEDTRILVNAMSGRDIKDQMTFGSESIPELSSSEGKKFSVGYYEPFINHEGLKDSTKNDFLNMIEKLEKEGVVVKKLPFNVAQEQLAAYYVLAMAETSSNLARLDGSHYGEREKTEDPQASSQVSRTQNLSEETKRRIIGGTQVLSQGYAEEIYYKARAIRSNLFLKVCEDLSNVDILLSPVTPGLPPRIGESLENPLSMYLSDIYTVGFSLVGVPTLSAPLGLKTGIQITAGRKEEEKIFHFATMLQELLS